MAPHQPQDEFAKYKSSSPWNSNEDKQERIRNIVLGIAGFIGLAVFGLWSYGNGNITRGIEKLFRGSGEALLIGAAGTLPTIIFIIIIIVAVKRGQKKVKEVKRVKQEFHQQQNAPLSQAPLQAAQNTFKTIFKSQKNIKKGSNKTIWALVFFFVILPAIMNAIEWFINDLDATGYEPYKENESNHEVEIPEFNTTEFDAAEFDFQEFLEDYQDQIDSQ